MPSGLLTRGTVKAMKPLRQPEPATVISTHADDAEGAITFDIEILQRGIKAAAKRAQSELHAQGLGYVHGRDGQVIETMPDGSERVLFGPLAS